METVLAIYILLLLLVIITFLYYICNAEVVSEKKSPEDKISCNLSCDIVK